MLAKNGNTFKNWAMPLKIHGAVCEMKLPKFEKMEIAAVKEELLLIAQLEF